MEKIKVLCNSCRTYLMLWRITNNDYYKILALESLNKAKVIYKLQKDETELLMVA